MSTDPTFAENPTMDREQRRQLIERDSLAECDRQDLKWGTDRDIPNGTGGSYAHTLANESRDACQWAFAKGEGTWKHIFREEVFEAFAEDDPAKLRIELIQCRAVLTQWIDNIDRAKS